MSAGCTLLLNDGTIIALAIVAIIAPRFRICDFEVLRLQLVNLIHEFLLVLFLTLNILKENILVFGCEV